MPIVDMSVAELQKYRGINEKPADFDAYWDEAIREMEALGTDAEFIPADFQVKHAECFHVYFTGVGGSRVHGVYIKPRQIEGAIPAVVEFHGYSGNVGDFRDKLGWATAGMCYAGLDCRGQSGKSEDLTPVKGNTLHGHIVRGLDDPDPRKLYYRSMFLDTAQFVRIIAARPEVDAAKVGAMGGSQGGGLTVACAALTPWLNRAAVTYPFLTDYRRVWDMDLDANAYCELREFFRFFDPRHLREEAIFTKLGYIDVHHLAPRIQARVRMYTGLIDPICPPSTQYAVYNNITAPKDHQLYPDFGHEWLPGAADDTMQFMLDM